MLPGFTAIDTGQPSVALAGPWDSPKTCRPLGTDTFCTGLVMWCKDVYFCPDYRSGSPVYWHDQLIGYGRLDTHTPYPCGVCVGVTSPDDW
jgi:hypothetical protein